MSRNEQAIKLTAEGVENAQKAHDAALALGDDYAHSGWTAMGLRTAKMPYAFTEKVC